MKMQNYRKYKKRKKTETQEIIYHGAIIRIPKEKNARKNIQKMMEKFFKS